MANLPVTYCRCRTKTKQ